MTSSGSNTHVLSQGGFKSVESQRKHLLAAGIGADVVCPPGEDPNK